MGARADAMREAAKRKPTPPAPVAKLPPKVAPPKAPPPIIPPVPTPEPKPPHITYKCGHTRTINSFASENCGTCRRADKLKKAAQKRERRRAAPLAPDLVKIQAGRLPDGARFNVAYDAQAETWSGVLQLPENASPFMDSASGVFSLLKKLDAQYRAATPAI